MVMDVSCMVLDVSCLHRGTHDIIIKYEVHVKHNITLVCGSMHGLQQWPLCVFKNLPVVVTLSLRICASAKDASCLMQFALCGRCN